MTLLPLLSAVLLPSSAPGLHMRGVHRFVMSQRAVTPLPLPNKELKVLFVFSCVFNCEGLQARQQKKNNNDLILTVT